MANQEVAKRNRPQIVVMLVVLPLLSVFATYSLIWLEDRETLMDTTNQGEFVNPPVLARELGLSDATGAPVDGSGTWWIWLVVSDCTAACAQGIEAIQAVRQRLDPAEELVRYAVVTGLNSESSPASGWYSNTPRFISDGEKSLPDGIYLVDSGGNVVLKYALNGATEALEQDLFRLLELSEQD